MHCRGHDGGTICETVLTRNEAVNERSEPPSKNQYRLNVGMLRLMMISMVQVLTKVDGTR